MPPNAPPFDSRGRDRTISAMLADRNPMLLALRNATVPRRQLSSMQFAYVRSDPARLFAAIRALPREATDEEVRNVANAIDTHSPSIEVINWRKVKKSSGPGYRPICALPPILKAEHYLVLDLIAASMRRIAHSYDVHGRGTYAAIETFRNALEEGYDWCWQGDIRTCFQAVEPDALVDRLPLPRPIVTNWLDYRRLNLSPEPLIDGSSSSGRLYVARDIRRNRPRGLLQGSPASNSILALLLSSLARVFALHECVACLFADNLFVAAKTRNDRDAIVSEICDHLTTHPAGRFRLHKQRTLAPKERFDMLGWTLIPTDDDIGLEPTHAALERMWKKLDAAETSDTSRADGEITETLKVVNGYTGSFKPWSETGELMAGAVERAKEFVQTATLIRRARDRLAASAH